MKTFFVFALKSAILTPNCGSWVSHGQDFAPRQPLTAESTATAEQKCKLANSAICPLSGLNISAEPFGETRIGNRIDTCFKSCAVIVTNVDNPSRKLPIPGNERRGHLSFDVP